MTQLTDKMVLLIWEVVIAADRLCRYYGYIAYHRSDSDAAEPA